MNMRPIVNTEEPMSAMMLRALNRVEATHAVQGIDQVSEEYVRDFLAREYGHKLAAQFKPEYLFSIPTTSAASH
jgi:hypothetical protein